MLKTFLLYNIVSSFLMVLLYKNGKGKNFKNLEKLIKKYHLEKQVHLLGYRKDIEEILQTADCFVFPSIREGLGITPIITEISTFLSAIISYHILLFVFVHSDLPFYKSGAFFIKTKKLLYRQSHI